ncbi:phosphotransferase family protein [Paraburkholderia unamae]|uniref:Aminoglycoside phosphotransferase (APT) family kinase protein n=1 Tax=Paraburkholderia unamae TaxID=219649 RepID=A0ABX5KL70_9BURK|nr:phosphotransferase family protein [Paraburkholderia unamae]PVX82758.1 aminoglycoside phosphotransferase (APT) family kinase protein [Paraburkholderia unamae]CAG9269383.1 Putative FadE36, aminoglycoside phosphotransferase [Paraburkholderia unamae]
MLHEMVATVAKSGSGVTPLPEPGALVRLGRWLSGRDIIRSDVACVSKLSGGAIQENWRIDTGDGTSYVLRTDADAAIPTSCTRKEEYERYSLASRLGARVARPHGFCDDLSIIGKPFFILDFVSGMTAGHILAKSDAHVPDRHALAVELGELLGVIHRVPAPDVETVFGAAPRSAASASIAHIRSQLDALPDAHPALELCLREVEVRVGGASQAVFSHGDYRTGNYMVDGGHVTAILDWEFSGWGHPYEDLGWFTAPCWRFGRAELAGGGVGPVEGFLDGYQAATGSRVEPSELVDWQALAQVKWAVIALHQAQRHASGAQRSLELALSGRLVSGLALEAMNLLEMR